MTVEEVAEELRQHPATIYRKIQAGQLPAVRLGHGSRFPLRVDRDALDSWLASSSEQEPAEGTG